MYYNRSDRVEFLVDNFGGRYATSGLIGFYVVAGFPVMMLPCNTVAFAAFELPNVRDTCPVVRRAGETANHNT